MSQQNHDALKRVNFFVIGLNKPLQVHHVVSFGYVLLVFLSVLICITLQVHTRDLNASDQHGGVIAE